MGSNTMSSFSFMQITGLVFLGLLSPLAAVITDKEYKEIRVDDVLTSGLEQFSGTEWVVDRLRGCRGIRIHDKNSPQTIMPLYKKWVKDYFTKKARRRPGWKSSHDIPVAVNASTTPSLTGSSGRA